VWPPLFNHVTKGFDDTPAATKGSERMTDLHDRHGYAEARNTPDQNVTKYVVRILPSAMQQTKSLPSLSTEGQCEGKSKNAPRRALQGS
jgi:hypothetical protein